MTDPIVTLSVWSALGKDDRPVATEDGPRISERLAARLGLAYLSFAVPEIDVTGKPHSPVVRLMRRSEFEAMRGSAPAMPSDPLVWVVEAQGSWRTGGITPEEARQDLSVGLVVFDAAFAKPDIYEYLEERQVLYAMRLPGNEVLQREIAALLRRPVGRPPKHPVIRYDDFGYQAGSWVRARRVVAKVEWRQGELFPRVGFIVTNMSAGPEGVVHFYNGRGTAEQWIKEGKYALNWTRLSCHRFVANRVRLSLFILAYNLGNFLRRLCLPRAVKHWSLRSVQVKLIKMGGRLVRHSWWLIFQLSEVSVPRRLFEGVLDRIGRLSPAPSWGRMQPRSCQERALQRVALSSMRVHPIGGEPEDDEDGQEAWFTARIASLIGLDRRLTGLAGLDYDATVSFGLLFEPEDSQYGKSRPTRDALYVAAMRKAGTHRILSFDGGFDPCPGIDRLG